MIFKNSANIVWFFLMIPLIGLIIVGHKRRYKRLAQFVNKALWPSMIPSLSYTRRFWKTVLLLLSLCCVILAALRPQYGVVFKQSERSGHSIYLALDVSTSMLAQDVQPYRLMHAKREILSLMQELNGDKIGLIVFAGDAFIQCPLTFDYDALTLLLNFADPNSVALPGSDIGKAIKTALDSFGKMPDSDKSVLIVLSDGENFENDPIALAKMAKKKGLVIYTIGIGLPEGEPIPEYSENGKLLGYKKDKTGTVVLSKLNEELLIQVAESTGGKYYNSSVGEFVLDKVYKDIYRSENKKQKEQQNDEMMLIHQDRYQWFLALGLGLFCLAMFLSDRRRQV
jgi:Ca-activated chloride channel family protein